MNRLSLVLTYISGQVLIFWQEGQKVYKLILQFWIIFLFYSVNQKKVEMTIYNIIVYAIISLGSYIRYKKECNCKSKK